MPELQTDRESRSPITSIIRGVIWSNIVATINSASAARRGGLLAATSAMRSNLVNAGSALNDGLLMCVE